MAPEASTELIAWARAAGRRLLVLGVLPLAAAVVTAAVMAARPPSFAAHATVTLPVPFAKAGSVVEQDVSDVNTMLTSGPVVDEVSAASHVPASRLRRGLRSDHNGQSEIVTFAYSTTRRSEAAVALRSATTATMKAVFGRAVDSAQDSLDRARAAYEVSWAAARQFAAGHGLPLPADQFHTGQRLAGELSNEVTGLEGTTGTRDDFGHTVDHTSQIAALRRAIAEQQSRDADVGHLAQQFQPLEDAATKDAVNVGSAERDLQDAQGKLAAALAPASVAYSAVTRTSPLPALAQASGIAGAVGIIVAVAFLAGLELARPSSLRASSLRASSLPASSLPASSLPASSLRASSPSGQEASLEPDLGQEATTGAPVPELAPPPPDAGPADRPPPPGPAGPVTVPDRPRLWTPPPRPDRRRSADTAAPSPVTAP